MKKLEEAAAPRSLPVKCDSIDLLLFVLFIFFGLIISPPQGLEHATGQAPAEVTFNPFCHLADSSSHGRGGEVENKRVQACVEGAAQEGFVSPCRTFLHDETHNVGDVVGAEAQSKNQQCSQSHANGPEAAAAVNVLQP